MTDSRIISIQRGLLGGYRMRDQQWKDLADVEIDENVLPGSFGSNLTFRFGATAGIRLLSITGLDSDKAARIYTFAQAQEQAWEEKRRVRTLEEKRAAAGGITLHGGGQFSSPHPFPHGATQAPSGADPVAAEIGKAKSLLEAGVITDTEFQEIKSKILSRHF